MDATLQRFQIGSKLTYSKSRICVECACSKRLSVGTPPSSLLTDGVTAEVEKGPLAGKVMTACLPEEGCSLSRYFYKKTPFV
jgi:hypothetical protein